MSAFEISGRTITSEYREGLMEGTAALISADLLRKPAITGTEIEKAEADGGEVRVIRAIIEQPGTGQLAGVRHYRTVLEVEVKAYKTAGMFLRVGGTTYEIHTGERLGKKIIRSPEFDGILMRVREALEKAGE